jgi:PAS domain S-box-containing protein
LVAAERRQLARGLTDEGYRLLVERGPDGVCVYADGKVVFVNDTGVRLMLADSRDQLIGRPLADFVAGESLRALSSGIAGLRETGDCTDHRSAQMIRMDGSLLAVDVVIVKTVWNDEPAYQVITRDVGARHDAEAGLRRQAALVNHVSDAIIGTTAAGVVTSWNPAAESIYGRSAIEACGRPVSELVGATMDPVAIVASGGVVHSSHP